MSFKNSLSLAQEVLIVQPSLESEKASSQATTPRKNYSESRSKTTDLKIRSRI